MMLGGATAPDVPGKRRPGFWSRLRQGGLAVNARN